MLEDTGGSLAYNEWPGVKCKEKAGFGTTTFYKLFKELRSAGRIFCSEIDGKWSLKP